MKIQHSDSSLEPELGFLGTWNQLKNGFIKQVEGFSSFFGILDDFFKVEHAKGIVKL